MQERYIYNFFYLFVPFSYFLHFKFNLHQCLSIPSKKEPRNRCQGIDRYVPACPVWIVRSKVNAVRVRPSKKLLHVTLFSFCSLPEKFSSRKDFKRHGAKSSSSGKKVLLEPSNKKMIWFGNRKEQANLMTNTDCSLNLLFYSLTQLLLFHFNLRSLGSFLFVSSMKKAFR